MTLKMAIFHLPHGGAYGSIQVNKTKYSKRERESLIRRFTIEMAKKNFIGASYDVYGRDVGTGAK
jgi:glutamate dehydrogenase (NAD(P)+)